MIPLPSMHDDGSIPQLHMGVFFFLLFVVASFFFVV